MAPPVKKILSDFAGETFLFGGWLRWHKIINFGYCSKSFSFGGWLRRPGGQGGFRPPPYAPLDPLCPLQTAEGYPRTPLVPPRARPLASRPKGSVSGSTFGLAWGQQPIGVPRRVRTLHGTDAGARTAAQGCCRGGPLPFHQVIKLAPWSRGRGSGCAEGDSGPPRNGCKASWARPCEASGALFP